MLEGAVMWRYRDSIGVFLPDALRFGFPLLEGVFVLKLGFHSI